MICPATYYECIVRGDIYALDVGLDSNWSEVVDDPGGFIGTLVLREAQDDALPDLLTLTAVPQPVENPHPASAPVYMEFTATAEETQALPAVGKLHGYVQIAPISAPSQSKRLFNMKVDIDD